MLVSILALVAGVGVGGGAAYGTGRLLAAPMPTVEKLEFVPTGPILAPLVFSDGRLASYVSFEVQLEVPADRRDDIAAKMPVLLNAVNMRTYRTPMASGRDGTIPSLAAFRRVVFDAAQETYGKNVVRRAIVTQAAPI
ncbi:hypothetical protein BHE75_03480 [Sphingomonas haloaromaticamans]|nr:hypothetical protein BHE75_03480 [Sphingomonas haloaromaticamans]